MERQSVVEEKMTRLLFLSLLLVETSSYVLLKVDTRPRPLGGVSVDTMLGLCFGVVHLISQMGYRKQHCRNHCNNTYGSFI